MDNLLREPGVVNKTHARSGRSTSTRPPTPATAAPAPHLVADSPSLNPRSFQNPKANTTVKKTVHRALTLLAMTIKPGIRDSDRFPGSTSQVAERNRNTGLHIAGNGGLAPAAVLLSITAFAKWHRGNPWFQVKHVLYSLAARQPRNGVDDLLPDVWAQAAITT